MKIDNNKNFLNDIIIMIGMSLSGKTTYINNNYLNNGYQIVSSDFLKEGLKYYPQIMDKDFIYPVMELYVRSIMLKGLPIVIDEKNIELDSIFIWKKIAKDHGYNIKGIFLDISIETCLKRLSNIISNNNSNIPDSIYKKFKYEYDMSQNLKTILQSEYQYILDDLLIIDNNNKIFGDK